MNVRFSSRELTDLAVAWVALGVAFMFFLRGPGVLLARTSGGGLALAPSAELARVFLLSMATVGVGFLLHELAHKLVAQRFGQVAGFRADYGMLALAVFAGLAGFLFAAPGAVYHRGRITERQNGLIALAGPVTNLLLAAVFAVPAFLVAEGFVREVGTLGVAINLLLAGFNMLPVGPLDGRSVLRWSKLVFLLAFLPSAGLAVAVLLLGVGF